MIACGAFVAEEEKMETDNDQDQQKEQVANEEPMETDSNVDDEKQQQALDTVTQLRKA